MFLFHDPDSVEGVAVSNEDSKRQEIHKHNSGYQIMYEWAIFLNEKTRLGEGGPG